MTKKRLFQKQMKPEFCIQVGKREINNKHLTWCGHLNGESDLRYENLLNWTLQEKIKALNQIESNEKRRKEGYCLEKAQVVGIVGIVGIVGMVGMVGIVGNNK